MCVRHISTHARAHIIIQKYNITLLCMFIYNIIKCRYYMGTLTRLISVPQNTTTTIVAVYIGVFSLNAFLVPTRCIVFGAMLFSSSTCVPTHRICGVLHRNNNVKIYNNMCASCARVHAAAESSQRV